MPLANSSANANVAELSMLCLVMSFKVNFGCNLGVSRGADLISSMTRVRQLRQRLPKSL